MKILAINFGGIGDEIFFLPTLISLKKEFPDVKITLALEPRSKSIKGLTDTIDDLFLIDVKGKNKYFELLKLIFQAWGGHFDVVISSGGNKLISILLFLTGIKRRYGYDTGKLSRILLTKAVFLNKNQYACAMYHDLISPITDFKTKLPEINVEMQEKIPNSVLIHPGVSKMSVQKGMTKTISADIWAQTIEKLIKQGKHVILAGGPDDDEVIGEIERILAVESGKLKVENLSLHAPSPDGLCRANRLSIDLREVFLGESKAFALEKGWDGVISEEQIAGGQKGISEGRKFGGQEGRLVNDSSLSEILQEPQTDINLSTLQPFNLSTNNQIAQQVRDDKLSQSDTDLLAYSPIGLFTNLYGKTRNLKDLAVLIGKAEKFICSDSAPLHIGVAMKTKTYPIFGPTDDKKLVPKSELVVPIKANDNCPIKPCLWEHRQTTCENLDCLKITADEIVKIVCD